jgi:aerobic carbon-monoxide dehydrogenase medium subunit
MKPAPFTYLRAESVAQAVALLAQFGPEGGRVLAGGQSLVPLMAFRLAQPTHLIDINRIVDFGMLRVEDGMLCIPATTRHADLAANAAPAPLGQLLAEMLRHIAHVPIRARGTFCGSLAHADPAAEWPLAFATFEGSVVARSERGERVIPASDWFHGLMTTALTEDELLMEARLRLPAADERLGFYEISRRNGDYAMAMALVSLRIADGVIRSARIGVGGAEPMPRRIAEVEALLTGATPDAFAFHRAANAAANAVDPMRDMQVSAALRRDLLRAVVQRALWDALA